MRPRLTALALMCAVAAACGGAATPTAPDPVTNIAPPSATTASIHGTVAGAASASTFNTNGAAAGMTVTIEGTSIQATVNGAGQFVLSNVPAGTPVVLRFNGVGANAQLTIGTVNGGQTITITVVVNGDRAELQEKTQGSEKEIEGRIDEKLSDGLRVAGRKVIVTSSTTIRHGDATMTMAQLEVGQRVHVRGTVSGSGATETTLATLILVQNLNTAVPVNLEGTISGLSGSASAFQFTLEGRTVKGGSSTEFKGGETPSFTRLANGDKVHVKGTLEDGAVRASHITLKSKEDEAEREAAKYEGRGLIESLTGACPSILFSLNGVRVQAGPDTKFEKAECRALANGTKVKVIGTKRPDGIVQATLVQKEEETKPEPAYETRGAISRLEGTCPVVAFSIGEIRIRTNASTTFEVSCSSLTAGTSVKVIGKKESDGSVTASYVKKG